MHIAQERQGPTREKRQLQHRFEAASGELPIPRYLEQLYWWAYVHPVAVRIFERRWLVNLILLGNYRRLCSAFLEEFGESLHGRTLQLGCVYGDLTARLCRRLAPEAGLDVVDILPIQLDNLAGKLPRDARVRLWQRDASSLAFATASYDQVLIFFLLHEQPRQVRRATVAEALRVVRPGGRVVIVDYHQPRRWHPLLPLVQFVLRRLKPYAADLWTKEIANDLPVAQPPASVRKSTYFGALYQKVVLTR